MHHLKDYSRTVGTEAVEIYPGLQAIAAPGTPQSSGGLAKLTVWNVSPAHTVWLSRNGDAVVGQPGSYPLAPLQKEEYDDPHIPLERLSAVTETGEAALTVELRHRGRPFALMGT